MAEGFVNTVDATDAFTNISLNWSPIIPTHIFYVSFHSNLPTNLQGQCCAETYTENIK